MNNIIQFNKPVSRRVCSFCKVKEVDLAANVKLVSNNMSGTGERCICSACLLRCEGLLK